MKIPPLFAIRSDDLFSALHREGLFSALRREGLFTGPRLPLAWAPPANSFFVLFASGYLRPVVQMEFSPDRQVVFRNSQGLYGQHVARTGWIYLNSGLLPRHIVRETQTDSDHIYMEWDLGDVPLVQPQRIRLP